MQNVFFWIESLLGSSLKTFSANLDWLAQKIHVSLKFDVEKLKKVRNAVLNACFIKDASTFSPNSDYQTIF